MKPNEPWYQILRRERQRHGWTQEEVARLVGCESNKTIVRWENGHAFPTPYYRRKLAKIYGMSTEELGLAEEISYHGRAYRHKTGLVDEHPMREDWGEAPYLADIYGRE